jgi:L-iditol 2-dehydrogenase
MKALMKKALGPHGVAIEEIPEPRPADNEIKIRIHGGGICGTDLHIIKDEYPSSMPVVMGHEYSGVVVEAGRAVRDFKPGDRVVSLTAAVTCGTCVYCREGLIMLCEQRLSIGSGVNGAFAEYMVVPAHLAFIIPDEVSLDEAVLCEPLACVVRAVTERNIIRPGDYVYVSGPGAIGQLTMQVAAASGGIVVVAGTSTDRDRLKLAAALGAHSVLIAGEDDIKKRTAEITDGRGFDIAFECAGAGKSAQTCLEVLKKTGRYAQVGLYGSTVEFDHDLALKKEIAISNSFASERSSWERTLRLLKYHRVNLTPLISARFPLEKWREAFDMALGREGFKIIFTPGAGKK